MRIENTLQVQIWLLFLRGTEEMKLFPTKDDRCAALRKIEIFSSARRSAIECAVAILIMVASFFLAPLVVNYMGPTAFLGRPMLIAIFVIALVSPFYYRSRVRAALRQELVLIGIPVCVNCCYYLHGLSAAQETCPECGHELDALTKVLIQSKVPRYDLVPEIQRGK